MTFLLQLVNQQLTENNVWQQRISVFLLLIFVIIPDYLSACPLNTSSFEKCLENVNIRWVLENKFWNTCWKLWIGNFENIFEIFWNYFVELFRIFSRNLKTSRTCRKNKFWINSGKIMEKHRDRFELLILRELKNIEIFQVLVKLWRNFEEKWGILRTNF